MKFKRNLLTIVYSFLFFIVFTVGFLQVFYLYTTQVNNRNLHVCIVVLSLLLFLIVSFFIKDFNILAFFQKEQLHFILLEAISAAVIFSLTFFILLKTSKEQSILAVLLLGSIYVVSRQLGGRLCGLLSLFLGMALLLNVSANVFISEQYINTICFLVPFAAFLCAVQVIIPKFHSDFFLILSTLFVLSILFAFAITLNAFVCFLLIGCVFSLFFVKPLPDTKKQLSGPVLAVLLALFVGILLLITNLYWNDLFTVLIKEMDFQLIQSGSWRDVIQYLFEKFTFANTYIFVAFPIAGVSITLLFLGTTTGYYAIRKKFFAIGPLCLAFLGTFVFYLLFEDKGSHFYYMTYFLPIFSAYGLYNSLLKEDFAVENFNIKEEQTNEIIPEQLVSSLEITHKKEVTTNNEWSNVKMNQLDTEFPEWKISDTAAATETNEMRTDEVITEEATVEEKIPEEITLEKIKKVERPPFLQEENTLAHQKDENDDQNNTTLNMLLDRLKITDKIRRMNESAQEDIADVIEKEDLFYEDSSVFSTVDALVLEDANGNMYAAKPEQPEEPEQITLIYDDQVLPKPEHEEKHSNSTLPKYVKPDFDFKMEPMSQPLNVSDTQISEYDKVPTISDLEKKWRDIKEASYEKTVETVSLAEDIVQSLDETISEQTEEGAAGSGFAFSLDDVAAQPVSKEEDTQEANSSEIHTEKVVKKNGIAKRFYHKIIIR